MLPKRYKEGFPWIRRMNEEASLRMSGRLEKIELQTKERSSKKLHRIHAPELGQV